MKTLHALLMISLFVLASTSNAGPPTESIYQLNIALTNQDNKPIKLDVYGDHPTLITMFYGSCPNVCPLLIETLQRMDTSLDARQRSDLRVLMVSIDPDRDTPAALTVVVKNHRIDSARWTLARASAGDVRKLAAVLNIQYRKLPNGEFNHSTVITLLDATGRNIAATSRLGGMDDDFLQKLRSSLKN